MSTDTHPATKCTGCGIRFTHGLRCPICGVRSTESPTKTVEQIIAEWDELFIEMEMAQWNEQIRNLK